MRDSEGHHKRERVVAEVESQRGTPRSSHKASRWRLREPPEETE